MDESAIGRVEEQEAPEPDEDGAYEATDPKHPEYHSTHADLWDLRDKTEGR